VLASNSKVQILSARNLNTAAPAANGEWAATLKSFMALPRYGSVEEIAGMIAHLATPEAGYITGASLTIDGGFSA
jgi:3-oxoacyl-[acyl-carrier protein] reductase